MQNNYSATDSLKWDDVGKAIETQARVIFAIILRDTKSRYGEHKLGFLWVLLEPALFIIGFAIMHAAIGSSAPHGMGTELFMLTGVAPYLLFRGTMTQAAAAITANKALLAFPQVTTFDLIFARSLLEFATVISVTVILLFAVIAFGIEVQIEYPMQFLGAFCLFYMTGLGLGMSLGALAPFMPSIRQISDQVFGRPLFFTSGLFFTADQIPESIRNILLYNPLLHMTELVRSAFFKTFESTHMDLRYASLFALILLVFGLLMHQALHKRALGL